MVGLFINTVPIRIRCGSKTRVGDLLSDLQSRQAQLLEHQYLSLRDIHQLAGVGELFDTLIVYRNYPSAPTASGSGGSSIKIRQSYGFDGTHYPLSITVVPGATLHFRFTYSPESFRRADVEEIGRRLGRLLAGIAENDQTPVGMLNLLAANEKRE